MACHSLIPADAGSRTISRSSVIGLLAITAAALVLRVWRLDAESLWMDELSQVELYSLPLHHVIIGAANHGQPPLDYLIGAALMRLGLAGTDWMVRLPAAVFGAASIGLFGWWLWRIGGAAVGLLAAGLLAVCPLHVAMSQEARPYTIFVFFTVLTALAYERARGRHALGAWLAFGAAVLGLLLTRWVGPHFVVMGVVVYALGAWVATRRRGTLVGRRVETQRMWATGTALAIAYAVYGPLFGLILSRVAGHIGYSAASAAWSERFGVMLWQACKACLYGLASPQGHVVAGAAWLMIAVLALAGLGTAGLLARRSREADVLPALFLLITVVGPLLYAATYTTMSKAWPKPQYLLLISLFVCGGGAMAADWVRRATAQFGSLVRVAGIAIAVSLMAVPMAMNSAADLATLQKRDWRGAWTHLRVHAADGDAIALVAPHWVPQGFEPYAHGMRWYHGRTVDCLPVRLGTPADALSCGPWNRRDNTVWLLCFTDGPDLPNALPVPSALPEHYDLAAFNGIFLVSCPSDRQPAAKRLVAALGAVGAELEPGQSYIAPHVLRARYYASRGDRDRARVAYAQAMRQCRHDRQRTRLAAILASCGFAPTEIETARRAAALQLSAR